MLPILCGNSIAAEFRVSVHGAVEPGSASGVYTTKAAPAGSVLAVAALSAHEHQLDPFLRTHMSAVIGCDFGETSLLVNAIATKLPQKAVATAVASPHAIIVNATPVAVPAQIPTRTSNSTSSLTNCAMVTGPWGPNTLSNQDPAIATASNSS